MGEKSNRRQGWEWKSLAWMGRHPLITSAPVAAAAGVASLGPVGMGLAAAGVAAAGLGWYRGHPDSWDSLAAPRLRSARRRWCSTWYTGFYWSRIAEECGLITENRRSGEVNIPRIISVKSYTPSTETVKVRMLCGQSAKTWIDASEALAVALNAERVSVSKVKPRIVELVVQHSTPFNELILPEPIPPEIDAVDLNNVWLGATEYGTDWTVPVTGQHLLFSGASGSGKNSPIWNILRACAPLIRDGLVRLHTANPKETELQALEPISYRYATTETGISDMVRSYWEDTITPKKAAMAKQGKRKFEISRETPLDLLLIDEIGAVTGYGRDRMAKREVQECLALTLSQARALGGTVIGALQEPSKDVLPQRDLFTVRCQLRATSAAHVDMVLGEDMRRRGALADEIPNIPETAGIGYVVKERTRTPLQVRAAFCNDDDINDMVRIAGWPHTELNPDSSSAAPIPTEEAADERTG